MVTAVEIPEMGESVAEVLLLEWLASDGEYVERDKPICILETDKANVDLPAPAAGVLQTLVEVDATLEVGDQIATIDASATPSDKAPAVTEPIAETAAEEPTPPAPAPAPAAAAPVPAPARPSASLPAVAERAGFDGAELMGIVRDTPPGTPI